MEPKKLHVQLIEDNPADAQLTRRVLEAGANFFVSKPYEAGAVLSAIDASISEKGIPRELKERSSCSNAGKFGRHAELPTIPGQYR